MTPTVESKLESSADSNELQCLALSRVQSIIRDLVLSQKIARGMANALKSSSFQMEKRLLQESQKIYLYCPETRAYPLQLIEIDNPSSILYWKGKERIADRPCLAFAGSRICTAYGKKQTIRIINELAQVNPKLIIVSGQEFPDPKPRHQRPLLCIKTVSFLLSRAGFIRKPVRDSTA